MASTVCANPLLQIVFADTFTQTSHEQDNFDAIRFTDDQAVILREVHICRDGHALPRPPGFRSMLNDCRTAPSHFNLTIYARNLAKPDQAVYQQILECQVSENKDNRFRVDVSVPTDHVLIRGHYSSISLVLVANSVSPHRPVVSTMSSSIGTRVSQQPAHDIQSSGALVQSSQSAPTLTHSSSSLQQHHFTQQPQTSYAPPSAVMSSSYMMAQSSNLVVSTSHMQMHQPMAMMQQPVYSQPPPIQPQIVSHSTNTPMMGLGFNPSIPPPRPPPQTSAAPPSWQSQSHMQQPLTSNAPGPLPPPPTPPNLGMPPPGVAHPPNAYDLHRPPPCLIPPHPSLPMPPGMSGGPPSSMPPSTCTGVPLAQSQHPTHSTGSSRERSRSSRSPSRSSRHRESSRGNRSRSRDRSYQRSTADSRSSRSDKKELPAAYSINRNHIPSKSSRNSEKSAGRHSPRTPEPSTHRKRAHSPPLPPPPRTSHRASDARSVDSNPIKTDASSHRSSPDEGLAESESEIGDGSESQVDNLENISEDEFEFDESGVHVVLTDEEQRWLDNATEHVDLCSFEMPKLQTTLPPWLTDFERELNNCDEVGTAHDHEAFIQHTTTYSTRKQCELNICTWLVDVECHVTGIVDHLVTVALTHGTESSIWTQVVCSLVSWIDVGLDYNLAVSQSPAVMCVRHLKLGIALATQLVWLDQRTNTMLVQDHHVQQKLLSLLQHEHTCLPLKLSIIESLERSLYFMEGYHAFVTPVNDDQPSGYEMVVQMLVHAKQSARCVCALGVLVARVSAFETALLLRQQALQLTQLKTSDEMIADQVQVTTECIRQLNLIYDTAPCKLLVSRRTLPVSVLFEWKSGSDLNVWPSLFRLLYDCELLSSLTLVTASRLSTSSSADLLTEVFSLLDKLCASEWGTLWMAHQAQMVTSLCHAFAKVVDEPVSPSSHERELHSFGCHLGSLMFAVAVTDRLNARHAHVACDQASTEYTSNEDSLLLRALHDLFILSFGPIGRYAVAKVLTYGHNLRPIIACLKLSGETELDTRQRKLASVGYATELLLFVYRWSVDAHVLDAFTDDLACIGDQELLLKSAELAQWTEGVRQMPQPLAVDAHLTAVPDRKYLTYLSDNNITHAVNQMKKCVEQLGQHNKVDSIGGVIMLLRLVADNVCTPAKLPGGPVSLRRCQSLLHFYSMDTLNMLITLLTKLTSLYEINWQQGVRWLHRDGGMYFACVTPVLRIINAIINMLTSATDITMTDVSCVQPLLSVYAVCCTTNESTCVPLSSTLTSKCGLLNERFVSLSSSPVETIRQTVLDCMRHMTKLNAVQTLQPGGGATPGNDNSTTCSFTDKQVFHTLKKSLCSKALGVIVDNMNSSPCNMLASMHLLSELLPLPLPVLLNKAEQVPAESDWHAACAVRKLWSAHLIPVERELCSVLSMVCTSTHTPLAAAARRLVVQLCSLDSHIARIVCTSVMDRIINLIEQPTGYLLNGSSSGRNRDASREDTHRTRTTSTSASAPAEKKPEAAPVPVDPWSVPLPVPADLSLTSCVCLLAACTTQPIVKNVVLQLLSENTHDSLLVYLTRLLNHARSPAKPSVAQTHQRCLQAIVNLLSSLCDVRLRVPVVSEEIAQFQSVSDALPSTGHLSQIIESLITHIGRSQSGYGTIIPALRLLLTCTRHHTGVALIVKHLLAAPQHLLTLFSRLEDEFDAHSSDCISTLSTIDDVLRAITASTNPIPDDQPRCNVGSQVLMKALNWGVGGSDKNAEHALVKLQSKLKSVGENDPASDAYLRTIDSIIRLISADNDQQDCLDDVTEPVLPARHDLSDIYNDRELYLVVDECMDEVVARLAANWLWSSDDVMVMLDDNEDKVPTDLECIRQEFLPQFNPKEELTNRLSLKQTERAMVKRRNARLPGIINTSKGHGRPTRTPQLRSSRNIHGRAQFVSGVSGGRGGGPANNRDVFRNRPQNTSRAPSMHVDDFLLAEAASTSAGSRTTADNKPVRSMEPPVGPGPGISDLRRPGSINLAKKLGVGGGGPNRRAPFQRGGRAFGRFNVGGPSRFRGRFNNNNNNNNNNWNNNNNNNNNNNSRYRPGGGNTAGGGGRPGASFRRFNSDQRHRPNRSNNK